MPIAAKYSLLAAVLILAGSALLLVILFRWRQLIRRPALRAGLPGAIPAALLVLSCLLANLAYLALAWNTQKSVHDLALPALMFASATVLWLVELLLIHPLLSRMTLSDSITDPLLRIYSRPHIERRLLEEVARAQRYDTPLSTILLDVDQLAAINRRYGHSIGDQVLQHMAQLLHEYLRESDELARYGEDEILIVTPNTALEDAQQLAERIRLRIAAQPLILHPRTEREERVEFKVSIGVAAVLGSFDSPEKVLQRTENALQMASTSGNQVQVASQAS